MTSEGLDVGSEVVYEAIEATDAVMVALR